MQKPMAGAKNSSQLVKLSIIEEANQSSLDSPQISRKFNPTV